MSTPMETNTEELREILQQVYDLPEAGSGGSAEPDLVIGFDDANWEGITGPDQFTFDQDAVVATYNKLLTGQTVNCVLNAVYWPNSGGAVRASSPQVAALAKSEPNNSARAGYMTVFFNLWCYLKNRNGFWTFLIDFVIIGDGAVGIQNAQLFATCDFTSVLYTARGI